MEVQVTIKTHSNLNASELIKKIETFLLIETINTENIAYRISVTIEGTARENFKEWLNEG